MEYILTREQISWPENAVLGPGVLRITTKPMDNCSGKNLAGDEKERQTSHL
jgi:hypothetical protein